MRRLLVLLWWLTIFHDIMFGRIIYRSRCFCDSSLTDGWGKCVNLDMVVVDDGAAADGSTYAKFVPARVEVCW